MKVPQKVKDRINSSIKRFQPILASARSRDVNEADTVTIVTDMLSEVFGYDKYSEITSEFSIRSTYCDIGIKIDGKLTFLIEVKAIGLDLKDNHIKQSIDYACNQGVEWVILTNGNIWQAYKVCFTQPIDKELVAEFNIQNFNTRSKDSCDSLFILTKEGYSRSALESFHDQQQVLNKYLIGAIILSEPSLSLIKKSLKRMSKDIKVNVDEVLEILTNQVLKRELLEDDKFKEALRKAKKGISKKLKETLQVEKRSITPKEPLS